MRITTLIENQLGDKKDLYIEHGLSVYIELDGKKILFDTGQSGNFIDNAEKLNINLKKLDYIIMSHGHYDHSGGFERLIEEIKPNIKLYIGKGFFNEKFSLIRDEDYDYTGNSFNVDFLTNNNIPVEYVDKDITRITENLLIFTNFIRDEEFENTNETMYIKTKGKYEKDIFLDEVCIGIKTRKGLVVIVGCSHAGIINILDTIILRTGMNIYALIGGLHLVKEDDEKINRVIDSLKEKDIKIIGACHCTGKQGMTMLSQQLEHTFMSNNTGVDLDI